MRVSTDWRGSDASSFHSSASPWLFPGSARSAHCLPHGPLFRNSIYDTGTRSFISGTPSPPASRGYIPLETVCLWMKHIPGDSRATVRFPNCSCGNLVPIWVSNAPTVVAALSSMACERSKGLKKMGLRSGGIQRTQPGPCSIRSSSHRPAVDLRFQSGFPRGSRRTRESLRESTSLLRVRGCSMSGTPNPVRLTLYSKRVCQCWLRRFSIAGTDSRPC